MNGNFTFEGLSSLSFSSAWNRTEQVEKYLALFLNPMQPKAETSTSTPTSTRRFSNGDTDETHRNRHGLVGRLRNNIRLETGAKLFGKPLCEAEEADRAIDLNRRLIFAASIFSCVQLRGLEGYLDSTSTESIHNIFSSCKKVDFRDDHI